MRDAFKLRQSRALIAALSCLRRRSALGQKFQIRVPWSVSSQEASFGGRNVCGTAMGACYVLYEIQQAYLNTREVPFETIEDFRRRVPSANMTDEALPCAWTLTISHLSSN